MGIFRTENFIADFRVYVDGKLMDSRLRFGKDDGDKEVSVPLTEKDRFLTVVSTDCSFMSYDQVLMIDPILQF